jgi:hypothetical protein
MVASAPTPKDLAEQYIEALNTRNPAHVASLFRTDAVHITAAQTVAGSAAIQAGITIFSVKRCPMLSLN